MTLPTDDDLPNRLNDFARNSTAGPSIVDAVMARVAQTEIRPAPNLQLRRWIMRTSLGLAACLLVAISVSLLTRPRVALADVLDKIAQTHTLTFKLVDSPAADKPKTPHPDRMYVKGDSFRVEMSANQYMILNRATGRGLMVDNAKHEATKMQYAAGLAFDFYALLKDFKDGKEQSLGEQTIAGRKLVGFKIVRTFPGFGEASQTQVLTLWVDPATELPVRAQFPPEGSDTVGAILDDLQFDTPLDDALFAMTVPAGYKVEELGGLASDQLKNPPTTQEAANLLILRPGVGIGSLKFGSTKNEVFKALGQPEINRKDFDFGYPSKGLFVLVHPKAGLVSMTAMSKKMAGPFAMNPFIGATDKGIAMEATRAQIESAYGTPTKVNQYASTMTQLEYEPLGATFMLSNDHLVEIFLREVRPDDK